MSCHCLYCVYYVYIYDILTDFYMLKFIYLFSRALGWQGDFHVDVFQKGGFILLMVQKSQGQPPGMVIFNPSKIMGMKLPTSTGERRISEPSPKDPITFSDGDWGV